MPYYTPEERRAYTEKIRQKTKDQILSIAEDWKEDPARLLEFLSFSSRFYKYSMRNRLLIFLQSPDSLFVGSFSFFREQGYTVKKGEHHIAEIVGYRPLTVFRKTPSSPWKAYYSASEEDKHKVDIGMYESTEQPRYYKSYVFDITQTTWPPEEYPKVLGIGYDDTAHATIYGIVKQYCSEQSVPVKEENFRSVTLRGYFDPRDKSIHINSIFKDTQRLSVLLHEFAHYLYEHGSKKDDLPVCRKEFEADVLAIMLSQAFEVPITDARKEHLADSYRSFVNEAAANEKDLQIDMVFEKANKAFEAHYDVLRDRLIKAGIPVPQRPIEEEDSDRERAQMDMKEDQEAKKTEEPRKKKEQRQARIR